MRLSLSAPPPVNWEARSPSYKRNSASSNGGALNRELAMICVPFIQNTLLRECGPESSLFPRLRAPKKGPPRHGRRAVVTGPALPDQATGLIPTQASQSASAECSTAPRATAKFGLRLRHSNHQPRPVRPGRKPCCTALPAAARGLIHLQV